MAKEVNTPNSGAVHDYARNSANNKWGIQCVGILGLFCHRAAAEVCVPSVGQAH